MKFLATTISFISILAISQSCQINDLTMTGCSLSSFFDADNSCSESALHSILGWNYQSKIELACNEAYHEVDEAMLPWSAVTKRGYQFDKEFFNGGSKFNTETDAEAFEKDTNRLALIRDALLQKHGIGWPHNIDNFNLESSCATNTAMCCWVGSRDTSTHPLGQPTDNTDVCNHFLGDAPRSSHVEGGESVFVGDPGPVNCHGFYWSDGDRYKGNLLFHVAMSEGLLSNGYVGNIPGAPMCGCVEQMPVVTHADCTDITVSETFLVSFDDSSDDFSVKAVGDPDINFQSCPGGSLTEAHQQNPELPGEIETYVTGKDSCTDEEEAALDALAYKKLPDDEQWIPVAGKSLMYHPSYSMENFNELFEKSPNQIVRRRCFECVYTHTDIYYRRYDTNGVPDGLDLLHIFKNYWYSIPGNEFHTDFELYSTYEDALNNENPWQFCNFNDKNVGFPRDCGPEGRINYQWNAFEPVGNNHGKYHVGFYVEGEGNKVGLARE